MKKLMAANWKMFKTSGEAETTVADLQNTLKGKLTDDREVLIFPPFTAIAPVAERMKHAEGFSCGGQNFYPAENGAYTGEIAPQMLLDLGCKFALTGHSERRHVFGESDEFVGKKTAYGLQTGLKVVLCIGETLEEREAGKLQAVVERQLKTGLEGVDKNVGSFELALAYEPVWAIGTGKTAGPPEILEAHEIVRGIVKDLLPSSGSDIRLLYGGSVKPDNCGEIIRLDNVDGVLVGGASLNADSFSRIVTA